MDLRRNMTNHDNNNLLKQAAALRKKKQLNQAIEIYRKIFNFNPYFNIYRATIKGYGYSQFQIKSIKNHLAKIDFASSPQIQTFRNLVYFPQYGSLYTWNGDRIIESCIRRGPNLGEIISSAPTNINIPKNIKKYQGRILYLGHFFSHWGHFLTESISRLWGLQLFQNIPFLFHSPNINKVEEEQKEYIHKFLFYSSLNNNEFHLNFNSPILISEVIIPEPSFYNRGKASHVHRIFPERVAKTIFQQKCDFNYNFYNQTTKQSAIYLSRSLLPKSARKIHGETELEKELEKYDIKIIYPETLSFEEQIFLINSYDTVIGCEGSALHLLFFRIRKAPLNLFMITFPKVNANYSMMNIIKGVKTTYIKGLTSDQNSSKKGFRKDAVLDYEFVLKVLRKEGVLPMEILTKKQKDEILPRQIFS